MDLVAKRNGFYYNIRDGIDRIAWRFNLVTSESSLTSDNVTEKKEERLIKQLYPLKMKLYRNSKDIKFNF